MLLFLISVSDIYGVEYTQDWKTLIDTPSDLVNYVVPKECEIINGGENTLQSSFMKAAHSVRSLTFAENSALMSIYPFVFSETSLESINMANCHHLQTLNYSLFQNCKQLNSIVLPEGLITILGGSLSGLTSLKSFKLPDTVKLIQYDHPYGGAIQSPIEEIEISPNSQLIKITFDCFVGAKIKNFYIPKNTNSLEGALFNSGVSNITIHPENAVFSFDGEFLLSKDNATVWYAVEKGSRNIVVPSYIKKFRHSSIRANHLKTIEFEGSIEEMKEYVFADSWLESFTFPQGITYVSHSMFSHCARLVNVKLTDSVTSISSYAFVCCSKLANINLDKVTTILEVAFSGCKSLTKIVISNNLASYGTGVFGNCSKIDFDTNNNPLFELFDGRLFFRHTTLTDFFGDSGIITIPSYCTLISESVFCEKKITGVIFECDQELTIKKEVFKKTQIKSITLPKCLKSITKRVFSNTETLEEVIFPPECQITSIGKECFKECINLKTIVFPPSLDTIDKECFMYCKNLTGSNFKELSLKVIGNDAFAYSGLLNIELPSTLESIGEECFGFTPLESIKMGQNKVSIIELNAFKNCEALENIELSNSVSILKAFAFSHCSSLTDFQLPTSISEINHNVFEYCSNLEIVRIPLNCNMEIKGHAFVKCWKLVKFDVAENDEKFIFQDGILLDKQMIKIYVFLPSSKKTIYVVPANIQQISDYAFYDCINLRTVVIAEGNIKLIGYQAFKGCTSLSSLYLPKTLTQFGYGAFSGCTSIKCGSVVYENPDKKNIIEIGGIPEIAFEYDCPKEYFPSCECHRKFFSAFSLIVLASVIGY